MEKDETWSIDRQYFDMRAYVEWNEEQIAMMTNELQQAAAAACQACVTYQSTGGLFTEKKGLDLK